MFSGVTGNIRHGAAEADITKTLLYSYSGDAFYCGMTEEISGEQFFWEVPGHAGMVMVCGRIFDAGGRGPCNSGKTLWEMYLKDGNGFLDLLNGDFSLVVRDERTRTTLLARDKMGAGLLYYRHKGGNLLFGSRLLTTARLTGDHPELNREAILKYLMFNYNPGAETVYASVFRLRPAHSLLFRDGRADIQRYWDLTFENGPVSSEAETAAAIREGLTAAVNRRINPGKRAGAFLSGGLDSSSIVSLLHKGGANGMHTYSFRCRGESFDESPFARRVATEFNTDHTLVEYGPEEVLLAEEMAGFMEEPFCDVGINVATFLLSRAAAGTVDEIFTGDGGDELFAGHPVYTADKAARFLDWIPMPLLSPLLFLGRRLKDSDKKKDLTVKIKRFSESYRYPRVLGTHRWRVYYHPSDLRQLIHPDFLGNTEPGNSLYNDLISYNREIKTNDPLARSLYSDYQTAVQFYLRRLDMAVQFGIRPRYPMLDPELAELCARVPSDMKLPGISDVKHIEKIAVEPLLPDEVVNRKDKLGHSIPLKNWMRENRTVRDFMYDVLAEPVLTNRGIVQPEMVQRLIGAHERRETNNSHRLWALMILELWLRKQGEEAR
ncbi:hypothetical protein JXO52_17545 [bacterium]|nr:hypothetical protein [bacterium]